VAWRTPLMAFEAVKLLPHSNPQAWPPFSPGEPSGRIKAPTKGRPLVASLRPSPVYAPILVGLAAFPPGSLCGRAPVGLAASFSTPPNKSST